MRRVLLFGALVLVLGTGCDDDSCSPGGFCYVAEAVFFEEVPVTGQTDLFLWGSNGNVRIGVHRDADRVMVSGTRSVRSDSEADAALRLEDLTVEVRAYFDRIMIDTMQPEDTEGRSYSVEYDVTLPADMIAHASIVNGNCRSTGATAGTLLSTINGNIDAVDLRGPATLVTVNGDVRADAVLADADEVMLLSVNGHLDLTVPLATSALVEARVHDGAISVRDLVLADLVRTNISLSGQLGDGAGVITLQTTNGNITLRGR